MAATIDNVAGVSEAVCLMEDYCFREAEAAFSDEAEDWELCDRALYRLRGAERILVAMFGMPLEDVDEELLSLVTGLFPHETA